MKKGFILVLAIILLNILNQNAFGQNALNQSVSTDEYLPCIMTFKDAIEYSLANNNNIKAIKTHLQAVEKDIGIAKSEFLPHAKFREEFEVTNNPIEAFAFKLNQTRATIKDLSLGTLDYPGAVLNFLTSLSLEQTILDRKSLVEIKIAKKEYSASQCIYVRKKEELVYQVSEASLKVITHKERIKEFENEIAETKALLELAQQRYDKKKGLYSDIIRAKSAVEEREDKRNAERTKLKIDQKKLGLLLGTASPIDISDSVPDIPYNNNLCYYKNFAAFRSDVKAMDIKLENARNNVYHEQADWWPTLKAIASYNFYDPYYPFGGLGNNYIAGAYMKWDIFDGNKRVYGVQKAKYLEAEAKEQLIGYKKDVNFKVYEAHTLIDSDFRKVADAIVAEKTAEESKTLIEKNWESSQLPFVAVIDSQYNLDRTRIDVINKNYDLKNDSLTLLYESGIIYQALGIE